MKDRMAGAGGQDGKQVRRVDGQGDKDEETG